MRITESFLNKVERKTNVSKQSILDLANKLKGDMKWFGIPIDVEEAIRERDW